MTTTTTAAATGANKTSTATTSRRLRMVPLPTVPDEELIKLQADLRRADTPVRYARAEYSAACEAVNVRMEEANKLRAALYDLVQTKTQGRDLWNAQIASQMAANRAQISAGLMITTRTKLELLETHRNVAQQALDDYVRDPQAYRLAREASERREAARAKERSADQRDASHAVRDAQMREAALKETRKSTTIKADSCHQPSHRTRDECGRVEQTKRGAQSPEVCSSADSSKPTDENVRQTTSRPLPPLPQMQVTDLERCQAWHEKTRLVFADYSTIVTFPVPPAPRMRCRKLDCINSQAKRELGVCHDDIERAFVQLGLPSYKEERLRWHPDRFVRCKEQEKMQRMAKVVFQIVDGLYRKERERQKV